MMWTYISVKMIFLKGLLALQISNYTTLLINRAINSLINEACCWSHWSPTAVETLYVDTMSLMRMEFFNGNHYGKEEYFCLGCSFNQGRSPSKYFHASRQKVVDYCVTVVISPEMLFLCEWTAQGIHTGSAIRKDCLWKVSYFTKRLDSHWHQNISHRAYWLRWWRDLSGVNEVSAGKSMKHHGMKSRPCLWINSCGCFDSPLLLVEVIGLLCSYTACVQTVKYQLAELCLMSSSITKSHN